jgi:Carboxypeptidase regulatory-like domain
MMTGLRVWIYLFGALLVVSLGPVQPETQALRNSGQARVPVPPQEQGYVIAGTVMNAITGAPLARARVSIADTRARMQRIEMETSEGGHFEFVHLAAGKYSLQGSRQGYITSFFEQHEQYSTAIVTGAEFATDKLVLRLTPMATISGHVLDESGEPVRSAQVQLFVEDHSEGMSRVNHAGGASSDDRGYFDIGELQPGTYFVSANAKPWYAVHPASGGANGDAAQKALAGLDVAYPTTYYGGATESDGAAAIELKGGDKREIDIRMSPAPALHLLFHMSMEEGSGRIQMPILQRHVFDMTEGAPVGELRQVAPGVMEFAGVPAGRYDVSIRNGGPDGAQEFSEMDLRRDGQDLSATEGEALGKLNVNLKFSDGQALPRMYVAGLRDAGQRMAQLRPGDANGAVTFEAVKPGKYALVVLAQGRTYAVLRISAGTASTAGHDVTVASGAGTDVTAEVAAGDGLVEGMAVKNGKPVAGVMVALVPNDPEGHVEWFRRDQSDFDGTFALQGVIPGKYTIVAVEDAWGFDWMKPGVLAGYVKKGKSVEVGSSAAVRLEEGVEVQGSR